MNRSPISIAMATYNGARFIEEQLESFCTQTLLPDEIVISDDGSTDATVEIAQRFAATAPFAVHIYRNPERLGYTRNFSRAASLCTGDLISFSDQDDSWYPAKLAKVAEMFERSPDAHLIVNDQAITDSGLKPSGATIFGNNRRLGFRDDNLIAGCCTSVRREFLDVLVPFPAEIPYDEWIGTMADRLGIKVLLEQVLQAYRRHGCSTTASILADPAPTLWALYRRFGVSDPRRAWEKQIKHSLLFEQRILERRTALNRIAGAERIEQGLQLFFQHRAWLSTRLQLLELSRPLRLPRVFQLWRGGFYAQQFGFKSAIKDAIRA